MARPFLIRLVFQWVVPGFGSGGHFRDLWVWNNGTGTYDFQDVIVDTFYLPYPTSNSGAPEMKNDPKNKSTLTVDKDYFNTNPEINFEYKSDAKKD